MRKFRITSITTILLLLSAWCAAQTTISYSYDGAGNRESRYIVTLRSAKPDTLTNTDAKEEKKEVFEQSFGEQKVLIYPNPTRGELKIELQGYDKETKTSLYLYSLTGKLLITKDPLNNPEVLNLSSYSSGTYVLKLVLGDKTSEWKIIKE